MFDSSYVFIFGLVLWVAVGAVAAFLLGWLGMLLLGMFGTSVGFWSAVGVTAVLYAMFTAIRAIL